MTEVAAAWTFIEGLDVAPYILAFAAAGLIGYLLRRVKNAAK